MSITISDLSSSAGWTVQGGRTYSVKLQVESTTPIGGKAAIDACNLFSDTTYRFPMVASATESDAASFLQGVQADPKAVDGMTWEVTLQFGPLDPSKDQRGPVDEEGVRDPFAAPPTLRAHGEDVEVAMLADRDGDPVLNKAGDPMPGLTRPVSDLVIQIGRNEADFPLAAIKAYKNHVNDAEWMGFPAESVLCKDIQPVRNWNPDIQDYVWAVEYELVYREPVVVGGDDLIPGWAEQVLNAGYREKVGGVLKQILVDGVPVPEPVPLKEDGTVAGPTDDPVYLTFDKFPTADFAGFGFDADLFGEVGP